MIKKFLCATRNIKYFFSKTWQLFMLIYQHDVFKKYISSELIHLYVYL